MCRCNSPFKLGFNIKPGRVLCIAAKNDVAGYFRFVAQNAGMVYSSPARFPHWDSFAQNLMYETDNNIRDPDPDHIRLYSRADARQAGQYRPPVWKSNRRAGK